MNKELTRIGIFAGLSSFLDKILQINNNINGYYINLPLFSREKKRLLTVKCELNRLGSICFPFLVDIGTGGAAVASLKLSSFQ